MKKNVLHIFRISLLLVILVGIQSCNNKKVPNYKNSDLPVEKRVDDLLNRMTLEEKFWQLFMLPGDLSDGKEKYKNGIFGFQVAAKGKSANEAEQLLDYSGGGTAIETAKLINEIQKYFIEETRLGIPIIAFDEALHGLVREGATAFPQSIALAATWDTALMTNVAHAITMETKSRGIRQILSPVLDIARDVRWGRVEETYGEDPFLVTQMGLSFISQIEKNGVIATPKHFLANSGAGGRDSYPINFNERMLEEVYLVPYKAIFQKAGARSVMTSYNSLNGRPCTANDWLLNKKLKKEWGFQGFVISDAGATGGANVLHYTTKNYAESTKEAIESGLDVIFQTSYSHYKLFYEAFEKGMVDKIAINKAVRRVLRAKFDLGLFENPYVKIDDVATWNQNPKHKKIAKKAALESIVLLKNENQVLPIDKNIRSIAIIGTDAIETRLGGYSGPGNSSVSILKGIEDKLGKSCTVKYSPGCGREATQFIPIPGKFLSTNQNEKTVSGLKGEYFNNIELQGTPALTRIDQEIAFSWTLYSPDKEKINYDFYSARWTGTLTAPESGNFEIGIKGNDGYRLYLDDKLIIDNWKKQSAQTKTIDYHFEKGKSYDIRIEYFETVGNVRFNLIWNIGINDQYNEQINKAVKLAKASEIAIVVVGINEGEFRDRALLRLPGHQEELIKRVAAIGKPVAVIIVGGSAVVMKEWINDVPAIMDIWYPGDEGGRAVADILFGDYSPAGRLPITFPVHEGQLPLIYNHKPTGRGDDYVNLTGYPLFPFGYGLSYTKFEYSNLQLSSTEISPSESIKLSFDIKNSGGYDGDEVVQLYIKDIYASVVRPIIELKGFQRIHLKAGELKQVSFTITPELLSMLDLNMNRIVEPGDFRIMIGASSNNIRLRTILNVKEQ